MAVSYSRCYHQRYVARLMGLLGSPSPSIRYIGAGMLGHDRGALEPGRRYCATRLPDRAADRCGEHYSRLLEWWAGVEGSALARWRAWYRDGGHLRAKARP